MGDRLECECCKDCEKRDISLGKSWIWHFNPVTHGDNKLIRFTWRLEKIHSIIKMMWRWIMISFLLFSSAFSVHCCSIFMNEESVIVAISMCSIKTYQPTTSLSISMPSSLTFQNRSKIKRSRSKLTKAISAFAYPPIKCSWNTSKLMKSSISVGQSNCRNLIQKHKTIAWHSVKFDVTHVLFVLDCFKPTVATVGSQFLFRHRVRCPPIPSLLRPPTPPKRLPLPYSALAKMPPHPSPHVPPTFNPPHTFLSDCSVGLLLTWRSSFGW